MNEQTLFEIKLESTPLLCVPGMLQVARHLYAYREGREEAIIIIRDLFQNKVTDDALISILTEERQPIFDGRMLILSETYIFNKAELSQAEVDNL
ncbi:MAG: hypothetical protein DRI46_12380 [Chloroflexi bacterium]|nr:MAG: hypothetical protein DRI46_12380 [Chloroflexota bacterium]